MGNSLRNLSGQYLG